MGDQGVSKNPSEDPQSNISQSKPTDTKEPEPNHRSYMMEELEEGEQPEDIDMDSKSVRRNREHGRMVRGGDRSSHYDSKGNDREFRSRSRDRRWEDRRYPSSSSNTYSVSRREHHNHHPSRYHENASRPRYERGYHSYHKSGHHSHPYHRDNHNRSGDYSRRDYRYPGAGGQRYGDEGSSRCMSPPYSKGRHSPSQGSFHYQRSRSRSRSFSPDYSYGGGPGRGRPPRQEYRGRRRYHDEGDYYYRRPSSRSPPPPLSTTPIAGEVTGSPRHWDDSAASRQHEVDMEIADRVSAEVRGPDSTTDGHQPPPPPPPPPTSSLPPPPPPPPSDQQEKDHPGSTAKTYSGDISEHADTSTPKRISNAASPESPSKLHSNKASRYDAGSMSVPRLHTPHGQYPPNHGYYTTSYHGSSNRQYSSSSRYGRYHRNSYYNDSDTPVLPHYESTPRRSSYNNSYHYRQLSGSGYEYSSPSAGMSRYGSRVSLYSNEGDNGKGYGDGDEMIGQGHFPPPPPPPMAIPKTTHLKLSTGIYHPILEKTEVYTELLTMDEEYKALEKRTKEMFDTEVSMLIKSQRLAFELGVADREVKKWEDQLELAQSQLENVERAIKEDKSIGTGVDSLGDEDEDDEDIGASGLGISGNSANAYQRTNMLSINESNN
ncbi:hypothetical protein H4219_002217 [Mycoemilia scoparia]|uniref:Uncharacterized protein n=1 Tax=Mycoemilia scoparia TaxID=417184 RepID=A0A9W8A665_9FUNG|nr:hypothetical protein H4219_002217 [Mycoemilia scoparia]